jgi:hypothetical protein
VLWRGVFHHRVVLSVRPNSGPIGAV